MIRVVLYVCLVWMTFVGNANTMRFQHSVRVLSENTTEENNRPLRIAFCLTGQLTRLEMRSKVRNIFVPNVQLGNTVHVLIFLDNEVEKIKQTFWKFDYSNTPYRNHSVEMLKHEIEELIQGEGIDEGYIKLWIRLEHPPQSDYAIVGDKVPVSDKIVHKPEKMDGDLFPEDGIEHAEVRFQNNMRWLGALRDCMKWVQKVEYQQKMFYDLVVRLRDDTYAFGKWIIDHQYIGYLTSSGSATFRGINDHNFVIDRLFADDLFRGITEDYYFNKSLADQHWGNPEYRIYQMAIAYNIPMRNNSICQQPLLPLRGKHDDKHWLAHASYANKLLEECKSEVTKQLGCNCEEKWLKILKTYKVSTHN